MYGNNINIMNKIYAYENNNIKIDRDDIADWLESNSYFQHHTKKVNVL